MASNAALEQLLKAKKESDSSRIVPQTYEIRKQTRPDSLPNQSGQVGQSITIPTPEPAKTQGTIVENVLTIVGFQEFYNVLKAHPDVINDKKISEFVGFVDAIPGACGCVKGQLNGAAQNMYGQMLPLLQAGNPDFFINLKNATQTTKIIFKDKDIVLLEV